MGDRLTKNEVTDLIDTYQSQLKKLRMQIAITQSAIEDLKKITTGSSSKGQTARVEKVSRSAAVTKVKKKRGRPAKVKVASSETPASDAPKRKRGRPAKVKVASSTPASDAPKKRRGRPAKIKVAAAAAVSESDAPKRRRGRPAKVKVAVTKTPANGAPKKGRGRPRKL